MNEALEELNNIRILTVKAFQDFNSLSNDINYHSKSPRSSWIMKRCAAWDEYVMLREALINKTATYLTKKEKENGIHNTQRN